nr:MAG TPA_asm: HEAD DECORATION PROTEIN [Caudoviricetes sp.]
MPKLKTETFGPGDLSWIGPDSANAGRTEWVDTADTDFTAVAVDGVIKSGTPLALDDGQLKPYTDGDVLIGFLYTDQPINVGTLGVPVFDRGRVDVSRLPATFTVPAADKDRTHCTFTKES